MPLLGILSLVARAAAPGRQLSRGLGAQSLEPQGSWGSWSEGDQGPRGKLQGAEGRPQHWGHHREELGPGQLPRALGPALDLTHERPRPGWNHRDHPVHLHSHRSLWLLALGPAVSSSHGRLAPWGTVMMMMMMMIDDDDDDDNGDGDDGNKSTYQVPGISPRDPIR